MKNSLFSLKIIFLIFLVLLFFALNSILARMAISTQNIDAFSFTLLRIISAMFILLCLCFYKNKSLKIDLKSNYLSGFMFFLYAICFSFSYTNMLAGIGTLILFAVVQLTMIILALFFNEKLTFNKIIGILIAFLGLVYLLYPKYDFEISYFHTLLMFLSGIGWAVFSVLGKKSQNAIVNAADSFLKAFIIAIIFAIFYILVFNNDLKIDFFTSFLAIISGGITTAFGVFIWYIVLPKIEIMTASVIQLLVPIIAIFLSTIFLKEAITFELIVSSFIIIFGIFLALKRKSL
ncbi:DMT family transporter [Aliarcobacter cibarius]|jgi:drug/metabolite transporter (DMT)-like permease|uniref:DMT family transporter n=1 Tax=Aliarcobacter cibarius TaxID=255507 RepID=A0A5J6RI46_9BACT|nr:DMT family transporter [Aliarcobacter cibarius]QEZ89592.1 EamA/RhaT family transporter [Aliarcobacter cibarius]QKJ27599.1 EamA/RhaT family transporter [Aliarcobacter cibarius]TLT00638.1 DMT family transporter [Aliarcobacter cibarius]TLT00932.1 DMT family transporter [Aliarcobacter cibarius]TLT03925.1 DMT family transporter [Aliarcobacter cibarius]